MFGLFKKKPKTVPVVMDDEYFRHRNIVSIISDSAMDYVDYKHDIGDPKWFVDAHAELTFHKEWFQDKVNEYQKRVKLLKHSASSEEYTITVSKLERYKSSLEYCDTALSVLEHARQIYHIRNN